jgi:hypothetical protein
VRRRAAERGSALVVALCVLALAGAAAASLAELGRSALVRARLGRDGVRAWILAETGLADAVHGIAPAPDFDGELGRPATDPAGPWTAGLRFVDDADEMPRDPAADANARILLQLTALGTSPVRRRLEAVLGRAEDPFFPGAASLRGDVAVTTSDFHLDGRDWLVGAGCMSEGSERARAGLALPESAAVGPLPRPDQVVGTGAPPSIVRNAIPDLAALADAAVGLRVPAGALAGAYGTAAEPQLTVVEGAAGVPAAASAYGVLMTTGRLRVDGTLVVTGVLAAAGGVEVAPGGSLAVCGGLWADGDPALHAAGVTSVRRSGAALRLAARLAPLPARATVLAVREIE